MSSTIVPSAAEETSTWKRTNCLRKHKVRSSATAIFNKLMKLFHGQQTCVSDKQDKFTLKLT